MYSGVVGADSSLTIELWHVSDFPVRAKCYFWCTADGELPERQSQSTASKELVLALVTN